MTIGLDVKAADTGDRVLRSELSEFWVAEGSRYNGSVRRRSSSRIQTARNCGRASLEERATGLGDP
jgi:hypothetical protein